MKKSDKTPERDAFDSSVLEMSLILLKRKTMPILKRELAAFQSLMHPTYMHQAELLVAMVQQHGVKMEYGDPVKYLGWKCMCMSPWWLLEYPEDAHTGEKWLVHVSNHTPAVMWHKAQFLMFAS